jgi:hypothetical protein
VYARNVSAQDFRVVAFERINAVLGHYRARTDGLDNTRGLHSNSGREFRLLQIVARAKQRVSSIEANGLNLQLDFSCFRRFDRKFFNVEYFRSSKLFEADDLGSVHGNVFSDNTGSDSCAEIPTLESLPLTWGTKLVECPLRPAHGV